MQTPLHLPLKLHVYLIARGGRKDIDFWPNPIWFIVLDFASVTTGSLLISKIWNLDNEEMLERLKNWSCQSIENASHWGKKKRNENFGYPILNLCTLSAPSNFSTHIRMITVGSVEILKQKPLPFMFNWLEEQDSMWSGAELVTKEESCFPDEYVSWSLLVSYAVK